MYKLRHICFALLSLGFAAGTHADEKRYISDDLITYIHSGPGNQYRIVGTLNSGEEVSLLSVSESNNYGQIKDDKGRTAWIPLDQLSDQPSLRIKVPALEQQVQTLTQKLNTIDAGWNQRTAEMQKKVTESDGNIQSLRDENQSLKDQLVVARKKVDAVAVQLDDKQRAIIMQWFLYGGGVAGVGLVLGLVLPHLIPRRKKDNRWMN
ncbi:TIGR04211 family SH3 domain-containing protein [Acerihabitans sp.]|uniref:TIGR04211 family SH3 domain-containing protein n=1 Tax=Acerihabitans sp. TaxID=2811394 RepID=UPI002EDADC6E